MHDRQFIEHMLKGARLADQLYALLLVLIEKQVITIDELTDALVDLQVKA